MEEGNPFSIHVERTANFLRRRRVELGESFLNQIIFLLTDHGPEGKNVRIFGGKIA